MNWRKKIGLSISILPSVFCVTLTPQLQRQHGEIVLLRLAHQQQDCRAGGINRTTCKHQWRLSGSTLRCWGTKSHDHTSLCLQWVKDVFMCTCWLGSTTLEFPNKSLQSPLSVTFFLGSFGQCHDLGRKVLRDEKENRKSKSMLLWNSPTTA